MEGMEKLESNVKTSFSKAKEEIELLKQGARQHSQMIEELIQNQNILLARIESLEKYSSKQKKGKEQ